MRNRKSNLATYNKCLSATKPISKVKATRMLCLMQSRTLVRNNQRIDAHTHQLIDDNKAVQVCCKKN